MKSAICQMRGLKSSNYGLTGSKGLFVEKSEGAGNKPESQPSVIPFKGGGGKAINKKKTKARNDQHIWRLNKTVNIIKRHLRNEQKPGHTATKDRPRPKPPRWQWAWSSTDKKKQSKKKKTIIIKLKSSQKRVRKPGEN